jgi:hypothetical protein
MLSGYAGLALATALVFYGATGHAARRPGLVQMGIGTAVEIVLFTLLTYATFLIENTDAAALRITSGSSIAGLVLAFGLGVPLITTFGAAGAMATLGLAAAGQGAVMSIMLRRRYGRTGRLSARASRSWRRRYEKVVASAFATVPHYREWWSENGIGAPTDIDVAVRRQVELIPLRRAPRAAETVSEYGARAAKRLRVADLHEPPSPRYDMRVSLPADAVPGAVAHHPLLGHLAVFGRCGQWHVTYPDFYAREVPGGVAFTALRRTALLLVDIHLGMHAPAHLGTCPEHLTPVLRP